MENVKTALQLSTKPPNSSGKCHFLLKKKNTQKQWVHREILSMTCPSLLAEPTLDSNHFLTSLWHIFHVNHLAIILCIFSELFVFLTLKCHVSLGFKRFILLSSQILGLSPRGSPLNSLRRQVSCNTDMTVSLRSMEARTPRVANECFPVAWADDHQHSPPPSYLQKLLVASRGFHLYCPILGSCSQHPPHPHWMVAGGSYHHPNSNSPEVGISHSGKKLALIIYGWPLVNIINSQWPTANLDWNS